MRTMFFSLPLMVLAICIIVAGCSAPSTTPVSSYAATTGQPAPLHSASGTPPGTLNLQIDGLATGALLPAEYTCTGASESPEVSWTGIPSGTRSLVLVLEDPDAPSGTFTHWLVYNIPPANGSIGRAQSAQKVLADGSQQGDNSAGSRGYYPPCPPIGTTHRYIFTLYAVDQEIAQPTANRESIVPSLYGHTLGTSRVVTSFRR